MCFSMVKNILEDFVGFFLMQVKVIVITEK